MIENYHICRGLTAPIIEERIPSLLPYVAMDGFVDKGGVELSLELERK